MKLVCVVLAAKCGCEISTSHEGKFAHSGAMIGIRLRLIIYLFTASHRATELQYGCLEKAGIIIAKRTKDVRPGSCDNLVVATFEVTKESKSPN
jgi:hypothetical protein